jgi:hypothetical protein
LSLSVSLGETESFGVLEIFVYLHLKSRPSFGLGRSKYQNSIIFIVTRKQGIRMT